MFGLFQNWQSFSSRTLRTILQFTALGNFFLFFTSVHTHLVGSGRIETTQLIFLCSCFNSKPSQRYNKKKIGEEIHHKCRPAKFFPEIK